MLVLRVLQADLFSAIHLGTAALFLFLGYFAHSFIAESIIHSVHSRSPDIIDDYDGYYGQAVQFGVFAVSCLLAPTIIRIVSARFALILTAMCFCTFFLGYFDINRVFYYCSQGLVGLGYGIFNIAEGKYLAEHSTEYNIELHTAMETGISHAGQFFAGMVLLLNAHEYRSEELYSTEQIKALYFTFFVSSVIAFGLFALLSNKKVEGNLTNKDKARDATILEELLSVPMCFKHVEIFLIFPFSIYQGVFTAFFLVVFPTSFTFNKDLAEDTNIVALYCSCIGIGVLMGGIMIAKGSELIKNFTYYPTMLIHSILMVVLLVFIYLTTAEMSLIKETTSDTVIQPSQFTIAVLALMIGICDCCITTTRAVICQVLVPEKRLESFSITKLYQAIASCVVFVMSPNLTVGNWTLIFGFLLLWAFCSFVATHARCAKNNVEEEEQYFDDLSGISVVRDSNANSIL